MPEEYAEPKKGKSRGKKKKRDTKRRDVIGEVDDETRRRFCHLQDKKPTSLSRSIRRKRKMGRVFVVELEGRTYRCKFCKTHLALVDDLVSRAFHCRKGKAYLFNKVVNTSIGVLEERAMLSGMHTVADIFCCCCGQIVGWKYEAAHERSQKYKEGKFVLERGRIVNGFDSDFYIGSHLGMSDDEE